MTIANIIAQRVINKRGLASLETTHRPQPDLLDLAGVLDLLQLPTSPAVIEWLVGRVGKVTIAQVSGQSVPTASRRAVEELAHRIAEARSILPPVS